MKLAAALICSVLLVVAAEAFGPRRRDIYVHRLQGRQSKPFYRFKTSDAYESDWEGVTGTNRRNGDISYFQGYEHMYSSENSSHGGYPYFTKKMWVCERQQNIRRRLRPTLIQGFPCHNPHDIIFTFFASDHAQQETTRLNYVTCSIPSGRAGWGRQNYNNTTFYSRITTGVARCFDFSQAPTLTESFHVLSATVRCEAPPQPAHSEIERRHRGRGSIISRVDYRCSTGYEKIGGSWSLTCSEQGQWQGQPIRCEPVSCGQPPSIPNFSAPSTSTDYKYGDYFHYECLTGHYLTPYGASIQCQHGGTWSDAGATCRRITCPFPSNVENGVIDGPGSEFGDTLHFSCVYGYEMTGSARITCTATGDWTEPAPHCSAILCDSLDNPQHGSRTNSDNTIGSEVTFWCSPGFHLVGSPIIRCQLHPVSRQGVWSSSQPECQRIECPPLQSPDHGSIDGSAHYYRDVITFSCDNGYILHGSTRIMCGAHGWDTEAPTCVARQCSSPILPDHASHHVTRGATSADEDVADSTFLFGDQVTYVCEDGYHLEGASTSQCGSSGRWDSSPPTCQPIRCPTVDFPEHGSKDGDDYVYGSDVTFSCFPGYVLQGGQRVQCQANGTWTSTPPRCVACPLGTYKDRGDSLPCTPCPAYSTTTSVASTQSVHCVCQEGTTRTEEGSCQVVECEPFTPPVHGMIEHCARGAHGLCVVSCEAGYVLHGTASRRCTASGWTGVPATCQVCSRDTYRAVEDGAVCLPCPRHTTTGSEPGTSRASCVCNEGYRALPDQPCQDIDECAIDNGGCEQTCTNLDGGYMCSCHIPGHELSADGHTCSVNRTCPPLDAQPGNGRLECRTHSEQNAMICFITCQPGFFFVSGVNNYITCGPDTEFQWSHRLVNATARIPTCTEEFFIDVKLPMSFSYDSAISCNALPFLYSALETKLESTIHGLNICRKKCDVQELEIQCRELSSEGPYQSDIMVDFKVLLMNLNREAVSSECTARCKRLNMRQMLRETLGLKTAIHELVMTSSTDLQVIEDLPDTVINNASFEFRRPGLLCEEGRVLTSNRLCVPCDAGYYLPDREMQNCIPCPVGQYQIQQGKTSCIPCPLGATTLTTGSDHPVMCGVRVVEIALNTTTTMPPPIYDDEVNDDDVDEILSFL